MAEYTKGPWHNGYGSDRLILAGRSISSKCIAMVGVMEDGGMTEEEFANAHLIAAAPDLYEALEAAIAELNECSLALTGEDYNNPAFNALLSRARGEAS